MNVVDSSGWLEYFADGPNADFFAPPIQETSELIVPSISIYEVFKRILQQREEHDALQAVAIMEQGILVEMDSSLAIMAARLSLKHKLPMADSVILATAHSYGATLWTQDAELGRIDGVRYIEKKA